MERNNDEKLLALFALSLVSQIPPEISLRIAAQLDSLGRMAQQDGDTSVGTEAIALAKLLADASNSRLQR